MRIAVFLTAFCALAMAPSALRAQITMTLNPVADANIRHNAGVSNSATSIELKSDPGGTVNTRKGYLRYDLSGINLSQYQIVGANFLITKDNNTSNNAGITNTLFVYGLQDGLATNANGRYGDVAWSEADAIANWSNANHVDAPANSTDAGTYIGLGSNGAIGFDGTFTDPVGVELGSLTVSKGTGDVLLDLSSSNLLDFIRNDTNGTLTFMLAMNQDASANVFFYSREQGVASRMPQLVLQLAPIPEPTSIAIWSLVGLGLVVAGCCYARRTREVVAAK